MFEFIESSNCPGYSDLDSNKDYWHCLINKVGKTAYHPTSTCRMGFGPEDKNAVVDPQFKVLGINNLRIVDASILPHITNARINAAVVVSALKGVKEIIKFYQIP